MKARNQLWGMLNVMIRTLSVFLVILLEMVLVVGGVVLLHHSAMGVYFVLQLFSVPVIYFMVNNEPRYKLNWVLIIFLLPGGGFLLYFLWGSKREFSWFNRKFRRAEQEIIERIPIRSEAQKRCCALYPNEAPISRYMGGVGYPVFENEGATFFGCGQEMLQSLLPDLENARDTIHIETFILDRGEIWDTLFEVLKRKAAQGVAVRMILDDFGCLKASTLDFRREVREAGIQLTFFAPINKDILHASFNFRTHQKYILIDEKIGYSGGINLADEYFDRKRRFGYWKDTATRVTGEAVRSMDAMFLIMWQVCTGEYIKLRPLPPKREADPDCTAFVRPIDGGPAKNPNNPVQTLYDMVITRATESLYITTPYLVIDRQMTNDLIRAARSGVDVRIFMPGIYDKSYVHAVSRHNFGPLLRCGIRVFEYTPGFLHAKELVADGRMAICGSINLDFRSLCEHYECGVLFNGGQIVEDIAADIAQIQSQSREVTYEEWKHRSLWKKFTELVLNLLAPLM